MSTLTINNSEKVLSSRIYITDIVKNNQGNCSYKLHVEVVPFNGYACTVATMGSNCKIISADFLPYGDAISIISSDPNREQFKSIGVTIPVGVYDCTIDLSVIPLRINDFTDAQCAISYSLTTNYYDGIVHQEVSYEQQA